MALTNAERLETCAPQLAIEAVEFGGAYPGDVETAEVRCDVGPDGAAVADQRRLGSALRLQVGDPRVEKVVDGAPAARSVASPRYLDGEGVERPLSVTLGAPQVALDVAPPPVSGSRWPSETRTCQELAPRLRIVPLMALSVRPFQGPTMVKLWSIDSVPRDLSGPENPF